MGLSGTVTSFASLSSYSPSSLHSVTQPPEIRFPFPLSHRQISVSLTPRHSLQSFLYVRSNHGYVAGKGAYRTEEVPKKYENSVQLHEEPYEWPAYEDQCDARGESSCSFELLPPCEEYYGLL